LDPATDTFDPATGALDPEREAFLIAVPRNNAMIL